MNLASVSTHTQQVIDRLETTGRPVHLVTAPENEASPYLVVQPSPGGQFDGSIGTPHDHASLVWLVKAVGQTTGSAQWLLDESREALLGSPLTVTGRHPIRLMLDIPGGVEVDRDVDPHLFFGVDRYVGWSTPA